MGRLLVGGPVNNKVVCNTVVVWTFFTGCRMKPGLDGNGPRTYNLGPFLRDCACGMYARRMSQSPRGRGARSEPYAVLHGLLVGLDRRMELATSTPRARLRRTAFGRLRLGFRCVSVVHVRSHHHRLPLGRRRFVVLWVRLSGCLHVPCEDRKRAADKGEYVPGGWIGPDGRFFERLGAAWLRLFAASLSISFKVWWRP